ncbi:MAG: hypothetical protein J5873_05835 [Bacteroidales bacterium]|nr:hypothetical protein [Bacteroidales bacterium]
MEQAHLVVLADFGIAAGEVAKTVTEVRLSDWRKVAQDRFFRMGFPDFPPEAEAQLAYLGRNAEGDALLRWCGIRLRISRHLIQCDFPCLFKTWTDYEAFRISLDRFLCTLLRPFQSTEALFVPSFWEVESYRFQNDWQQRRLRQLQQKITHKENSYKRSLLHLQHCLGSPAEDFQDKGKAAYWRKNVYDMDTGPLRLTGKLPAPLGTEELISQAELLTQEAVFACMPRCRNNNCPFVAYDKNRPSEERDCRLLPHFDRKKHPDFATSIREEGAAVWNAHCFFSLELRKDHFTLQFRKSIAELLYGERKADFQKVWDYWHRLLRPSETLLASAYAWEGCDETASYADKKRLLDKRLTAYDSVHEVPTWAFAYVLFSD